MAARVRRRNIARLKTTRRTFRTFSLFSFYPSVYLSDHLECTCFSPSGLVSSDVSLDDDGGLFHAQVFLALQPAADRFLDADAGSSQFIGPEFFQIRHLTCSEKDLRLPKLVLILILEGGNVTIILTRWCRDMNVQNVWKSMRRRKYKGSIRA